MIPLMIECLISVWFTFVKLKKEKFDKRKVVFKLLIFIHLIKFSFCVRATPDFS